MPAQQQQQPVVVLSYGLGVESTCILVRWLSEPSTCPCPADQLIAITSATGDEHRDTGRDVETYVLPLIRKHQVRYVQVARGGHFEADGIKILDDSRNPQKVYLEGAYKLSEELALNGTVPQYGGTHRCALKFKAFVIEKWLEENVRGRAKHAIGYNAGETRRIANSEYAFERIAFGFNADESSRITRSREYNTFTREAFYPLLEWGWTRDHCLEYLRQQFGVVWKKSACVYCPFMALTPEAIQRHREHPDQVADALLLEHASLALNPRGTLYKGKSLLEITRQADNAKALEFYERRLAENRWALCRVRRIFASKGRADRAVEQLAHFDDLEFALETLTRLSQRLDLDFERNGRIAYAWRERRSETEFPTREELYTVAPATVQTKARYGLDWFDRRWATMQLVLF